MELITRTLLDGAGRLAVQFSRRFKPIFLAQVMESVLNFIDPSISKDIFWGEMPSLSIILLL